MIQPIRIRSGQSSAASYRTFCCYGDTRAGKTFFAGTTPNALFISDASERGWTTLEHMPEDQFYHPGKGPVVLPVADQSQMIVALTIAEEWVRNGWITTVVIDSLTFYAESWYQHEHQKMLKALGGGSKGMDTRALYGAMANHLSNTRVQVHKWPCHVVWLALAAPPDEQQLGGPMLSGKSRQRFPAGCDYIFYHRKWVAEDPETKAPVTVYEARTQAFDKYIAGCRDGGLLPDPMPWPTFRQVAEILGLPEWAPADVPDDAFEHAITLLKSAAPTLAPPGAMAPPPSNGTSTPAPAAPRPRPPVRQR